MNQKIESKIESNYIKRLIFPTKRKLIYALLLALLLPLPRLEVFCWDHCRWTLTPLITEMVPLLFLVLPILFLPFISFFGLYATIIYLFINLLDNKVHGVRSRFLVAVSIIFLVMGPLFFSYDFASHWEQRTRTMKSELFEYVAVAMKNPNFCEKANPKSCYFSIAKKSGDSSVCDKLGNVEDKNMCYLEASSSKKYRKNIQ